MDSAKDCLVLMRAISWVLLSFAVGRTLAQESEYNGDANLCPKSACAADLRHKLNCSSSFLFRKRIKTINLYRGFVLSDEDNISGVSVQINDENCKL